MNLSFSGCGFLGIYHVGVASAFKEYAPHCLSKIAGASAGALAAAGLCCEVPFGESTTYVLRIAVRARQRALGPLHPGFDINSIIHDGLVKLLPDNAHLMCNGRLHVSLTRVSDGKNVLLSHFDSREDLIQALKCSCFIPFYSGLRPPKINGVAYMDGGFSDNLPMLDENTMTVSPFAGDSDICPIDDSFNLMQINFSNTSITLCPGNLYRASRIFFPPHPEILSRMCQQGFDDAVRFLQKTNMISCTRCLAVQSSFIMEEPEVAAGESTDSEKEGSQHAYDNCTDCKIRQQLALTDSLPEAMVRAIQEASDQLNKGVINWLFRHRPMKLISLLSIPYVLPIDIAIAVLCKLWQLLPHLRNEMQCSLMRLMGFAQSLVCKFKDSHPLYSAKFSCELNITEFNYTPDSPKLRSRVPSGKAVAPPPAKVRPPAPLLRHDLRSRSLEDLARGNAHFPPKSRGHRKSYAGLTKDGGGNDQRVISSMNFGFTMNLSSHDGRADRTDRSDRRRRRSVVDALRTLSEDRDEMDSDMDAIELTNRALNWEKECIERCQRSEGTGQLEQLLDVTQRKEALMAFYYTDETTHKVRVTELFNVTNADTSPPLAEAALRALPQEDVAGPSGLAAEAIDEFPTFVGPPLPVFGPPKAPRRKNSVVFMS
ncbi:hypothetical protein HPB47_006935 [Ixodes persulcatus]|uniref:Uncharacterized protein n=1 Tax=Ixodes persulcatus TaxID=34615 RepID=A0AC60P9K2_IXOPE|nr:hypothetical protein HPB47_006935 [Ixodes persulcatus]